MCLPVRAHREDRDAQKTWNEARSERFLKRSESQVALSRKKMLRA